MFKICLVFIPNLFIAYLISFRPKFYSHYKNKSLDFKISYILNILSGIEFFILPLLITFTLSDVQVVLGVNDFFFFFLDTILKLVTTMVLLILSYVIKNKLELNAIKIHNQWSIFVNDYSKKSGIIGFFVALIILLIFITSDFGGFG